MAPDLGERARRRHGQKRKRVTRIAAGAGAVLLIGGVVGAVTLVNKEDEPTKIAERPGTSTSSSSTSTMPTSTTVVPKSADPVVALAQQYDGYYEGTFTNTTYDTTGKVTLELRIDPHTGTLDITSTADGDVYGTGTEKLRTIKAQVKLSDPTAPVVTETEAFGEVTARLDADSRLILTALDVPEPKVKTFELIGGLRADLSGFDANFSITFEDGGAADGVISVICAASGQRPSEVPTLCTP